MNHQHNGTGHPASGGEDCIRCVQCDVANCKYNDGNRHCTAKDIRVGPVFAACASDTVCATFQAR